MASRATSQALASARSPSAVLNQWIRLERLGIAKQAKAKARRAGASGSEGSGGGGGGSNKRKLSRIESQYDANLPFAAASVQSPASGHRHLHGRSTGGSTKAAAGSKQAAAKRLRR